MRRMVLFGQRTATGWRISNPEVLTFRLSAVRSQDGLPVLFLNLSCLNFARCDRVSPEGGIAEESMSINCVSTRRYHHGKRNEGRQGSSGLLRIPSDQPER